MFPKKTRLGYEVVVVKYYLYAKDDVRNEVFASYERADEWIEAQGCAIELLEQRMEYMTEHDIYDS